MKNLTLIPALAILLFASAVSAQVYYPSSSGNCVILTTDLSFGSRGSEVTKLQQFLVSQNYPGGGNWMITGYFGNATVKAVRNFQQTASLPMTGHVDAQTRAAIQNQTCGYGGGAASPAYPYSTTPVYPTYAYPYPYTSNPPTVGSLSMYTGSAGSIVTVYGSNFDLYSNTVRFGSNS